MTVPNIFTGGTKAKASEVNENFAFNLIHRKVMADATERTTASAAWVDTATTFTLTAPVNSLLIGLAVKCELKNPPNGQAYMNVKIDGTNLGTKYFSSKRLMDIQFGPTSYQPFIVSTELFLCSLKTAVTDTYFPSYAAAFNPLKILDASTTFTVRLRGNGIGTVGIRNVEIEAVYVEGFTED